MTPQTFDSFPTNITYWNNFLFCMFSPGMVLQTSHAFINMPTNFARKRFDFILFVIFHVSFKIQKSDRFTTNFTEDFALLMNGLFVDFQVTLQSEAFVANIAKVSELVQVAHFVCR